MYVLLFICNAVIIVIRYYRWPASARPVRVDIEIKQSVNVCHCTRLLFMVFWKETAFLLRRVTVRRGNRNVVSTPDGDSSKEKCSPLRWW